LCLGLFVGRSIQSIGYPLIVRNCLQRPPKDPAKRWAAIRMAVVTALLFGGATLLSRDLRAHSWPVWAGGVVLTVPVIAAVALIVGATPATRRMLIARMRAMVTGLKPKREAA
jgi:hypothetical protein